MKAELNIDTEELEERITLRVIEALKPLLSQNKEAKEDKLLTTKEVCERYDVTDQWIYQNRYKGTLPHLKVGNFLRFREADLEKVFAKRAKRDK